MFPIYLAAVFLVFTTTFGYFETNAEVGVKDDDDLKTEYNLKQRTTTFHYGKNGGNGRDYLEDNNFIETTTFHF